MGAVGCRAGLWHELRERSAKAGHEAILYASTTPRAETGTKAGTAVERHHRRKFTGQKQPGHSLDQGLILNTSISFRSRSAPFIRGRSKPITKPVSSSFVIRNRTICLNSPMRAAPPASLL